MYLTNSQRTLKLVGQLARNPSHLLPYLRHSLTSLSPLDLELPWWSLKAIRTLDKHLAPDQKIFEWGSGGSTLFLAKRSQKVTTVEQNPEWLDRVSGALSKRSLTNATLLFRELNMDNREAFESCPYAQALESIHDVIIVDGEDSFGPDSKWSTRESCFCIAEKWIKKPGGLILVDDSWRYPFIRKESHAEKRVVHESIGPCRKGVTSTDFHYY
jgi:predicted O-methyltransferase YrrM